MKRIFLLSFIVLPMFLAAQNFSNSSASVDYSALKAEESLEKLKTTLQKTNKKVSVTAEQYRALRSPFASHRREVILGSLGTFGHQPRRKEDKRIDIERLHKELLDMGANTYHWDIRVGETDFEDLKLFLPLAQKSNIKIWVSVLSPTLARGKDMYCINYRRWAREVGNLSLEYPCIIAFSIDDFGHNVNFFGPTYMREVLGTLHAINPKVAFVPCIYYGQSTPDFIKRYKGFIDGVLFPFRNESVKANLQDTETAVAEINKMREIWGGKLPIILDVYGSGHTRLGQTTVEYCEEVIKAGFEAADGVQIFCHPLKERASEEGKFELYQKYFTPGWKK